MVVENSTGTKGTPSLTKTQDLINGVVERQSPQLFPNVQIVG